MAHFTLSQKIYIAYVKRSFDFLSALLGLILLSPLLLATMALLHFVNKGAGVFFFQERPGKDEKIFKVIKFKSMTDERDENGNLLPNDRRLTKVGAFIRKASIDELPQLLNVVRGDMSLIGPRPLLVEYLPYYTERERLRHTVRPGISGWAQVHGRNHLKWDDRLEMDVFYVEHLSLTMDCRVFMKTIRNVLCRSDIEVAPKGCLLSIERRDKYASEKNK